MFGVVKLMLNLDLCHMFDQHHGATVAEGLRRAAMFHHVHAGHGGAGIIGPIGNLDLAKVIMLGRDVVVAVEQIHQLGMLFNVPISITNMVVVVDPNL